MGTHPSGPSLLADNGYTGQPLLTLLRDKPQLLGAALPAFGCDLPFLFKVGAGPRLLDSTQSAVHSLERVQLACCGGWTAAGGQLRR